MEATTGATALELVSKSPEELVDLIIELEPKPIRDFVPTGAEEKKQAFLAGEIDNPIYDYNRLRKADIGDNVRKLEQVRESLVNHLDVPQKYQEAYASFAGRYLKVYELMGLARSLNEHPNQETEDRYMDLSREIYGDVEADVFNSIVGQLRDNIGSLDIRDGTASKIRKELLDLLPDIKSDSRTSTEPSQETINYWQEMLNDFYGGMLEHVPDDVEQFGPYDIRDVFLDVINHEFGPSAGDWSAVVEDATSINVKSGEQKIVVPTDRQPVDYKEMRALVVHELGIHMYRAIMGANTDLPLLKMGLAEYYDAEEGLGKVFGQAINGEYEESGAQYYLGAGLILGKSGRPATFRETFEILWRRKALLDMAAEGKSHISDEDMQKARNTAYIDVFRLKRGTNSPVVFLKDLAYFRGSHNAWKYLESAIGDEMAFSLIMLGKADPAISNHRRVLLETRSV